jgi:hypothetical protein
MRSFLRLLLVSALASCSSIPEEYQPVIDSLHTPEMEAAIHAARQADPRNPPPPENVRP